MNSESFLYQFVLLPLVTLGGFSVMLCFVFLLPGVGNLLAALYSIMTLDFLNQKRQGSSNRIDGT
jgi:uncharacterized protein involved in cysteine biosynthesis